MAEKIGSESKLSMPAREILMAKYGSLGILIGNSHLAIREVILFGSQRKGTNHAESDIDIAAIVDSETHNYIEGRFLPLDMT